MKFSPVRAWSISLLFVSLAGCPTPTPAPIDTGTTEDGGAVDAAAGPDGSPAEDTGVSPVDAGPSDVGALPDAPAGLAPPFRTPHPEIADGDLARQALRILGSPAAGATEVYCNDCHTLSRSRIRYWRALGDTAMSNCMTDLGVSSDTSATNILSCLTDPVAGEITTERLGIWATASDLAWFNYVFDHGVATDPTGAHATFVTNAGMPPAMDHPPLSQADFDIVAEWFIRGVPELDAVLPEDALPAECLPGVSDDVRTHVAAMSTMGWAARNRTAGLLSYGCAGASSPAGCLTAEPLAADSGVTSAATWGTISSGGVAGAHLRVLFTTAYRSSYWTRSSPDGRFVSHGAASMPFIRFIDLTTDGVIGGAASYDTFFFPDNTGFLVQSRTSGARVCETRVLLSATPSATLAFTGDGCSADTGIGLYEHLGASLDGADYWAISGTATYDDGGHAPTLRQPIADFSSRAESTVTLMTNDGSRFVVNGEGTVAHPYEGDATISPSVRLMVTRAAGPGDVSTGYVLHRLELSGSGASVTASAPEIGRYCITGAKPAFSYDERWLAFHHYIVDADAVSLGFTGPSDPGFAPYRMLGGANAYLVDLTTGAQYRLTNMAPGQYAQFPHFRSDGWIYFMVRTQGSVPEHVVASDAALVLAP